MITNTGDELSIDKIIHETHHYLLSLKETGLAGLHFESIRSELSGESDSQAEDGVKAVADLTRIREVIGDCRRCKLETTRTNIVFGEGNASPEIVFVGEGPGYDEDQQGRPFVGRAGKLLDRIIAAMGLSRGDVYICNIVKCRPPNNRNPEKDEIDICSQFLLSQLKVLNPKVICALGRIASSHLLGFQAPMGRMRGRFYEFKGYNVRPTYHPAALLRNPAYRRPVWEDMQAVMNYLGKPVR